MQLDNKTIPPISAEALKLRDYMRTLAEGSILTDSEIVNITKRTLEKCQGMIRSAIKAMEREEIVFLRLRNVGWRRSNLASNEVIDGESTLPSRVQRMAKRSMRRLAAVRFNELSNEDKLSHSKVASMNGIIAHVASSKSRDKVCAAVIGNGSKVETSKLLELFKA
jgi:hypothetical protein